MVEAGPKLANAFLKTGHVAELIIYKSQKKLGQNGVSWFEQDNAVENYGFKLESSCKIGSDLKEIYKKMKKDNISEIIDDVKKGKMVIIVDDESRENEGDLICAADLVTPEIINFMASKGKGLICLPMSNDLCKKYDLKMMTSNNRAANKTAFTVSIEAAEGITTGISAADRAHTIKTAVDKKSKPSDIVQPGHVFPFKAMKGGVLSRAGHTEAACDLAKLAGLQPAGVICEIMNEDGTMAKRDDLIKFGKENNIKVGTIADLIDYRLSMDSTIESVLG